MPSSATTAGSSMPISALAGTVATLPATTSATPAKPRARPAHWAGRTFSPSKAPATRAVSSGCNPTTSAVMPDGSPCPMAMNTPPRYTPCTSRPDTPMCSQALPVGGHGARATATTASMSTMTMANRRARKVSGSTYGRPSWAPIKPVLQSATKSKGTSELSGLEALGRSGVAWVMKKRNENRGGDDLTSRAPWLRAGIQALLGPGSLARKPQCVPQQGVQQQTHPAHAPPRPARAPHKGESEQKQPLAQEDKAPIAINWIAHHHTPV